VHLATGDTRWRSVVFPPPLVASLLSSNSSARPTLQPLAPPPYFCSHLGLAPTPFTTCVPHVQVSQSRQGVLAQKRAERLEADRVSMRGAGAAEGGGGGCMPHAVQDGCYSVLCSNQTVLCYMWQSAALGRAPRGRQGEHAKWAGGGGEGCMLQGAVGGNCAVPHTGL
jgi:hypothetical protein